MTTAIISDNASGAWTCAAGDPVEKILEHAANGRSVRVQMSPDATFKAKAGRKCWLPTSWIDGLEPEPVPEPEPKCCPTCGRELEES